MLKTVVLHLGICMEEGTEMIECEADKKKKELGMVVGQKDYQRVIATFGKETKGRNISCADC